MVQAIELPERIASLSSLANMDGDIVKHGCCFVAAVQIVERVVSGEVVASNSETLRQSM